MEFMSDDRELGIKLAKRFKLSKTALMIQDYSKCYHHIFEQALKECESLEKVVHIVIVSGSERFLYNALCGLKNLTEFQRQDLVLALVKTKDATCIYLTLCNCLELNRKHKNLLVKGLVETKNCMYACSALHQVFGLTKAQKKVLASVR